jgi:hypothetical protein
LADAFGPEGLPVLGARQWPNLVPVHLWESRAVIASVLVVLVALRLSPRRFTPAEVLLMTTFAAWAWFDKRVAPWWLMLGPWLLAPHLEAIYNAYRPAAPAREIPRWSIGVISFTLVCAAAALVLASPAALWAAGRPLSAERRAGPVAPPALAARLTERGPRAPEWRVFTLPYWWGDHLLWELPPDDQLFWYSRSEGYLNRRGNRPGAGTIPPPGLHPSPEEWQALVEQYGFNALVVWPESSASLLDYLADRPAGEWEVFADGDALLAVRRTGPGAAPLTPDP